MVTEASQAEAILADGRADMVLLGRALLRDPYWPPRAPAELGDGRPWPVQYERRQPHGLTRHASRAPARATAPARETPPAC